MTHAYIGVAYKDEMNNVVLLHKRSDGFYEEVKKELTEAFNSFITSNPIKINAENFCKFIAEGYQQEFDVGPNHCINHPYEYETNRNNKLDDFEFTFTFNDTTCELEYKNPDYLSEEDAIKFKPLWKLINKTETKYGDVFYEYKFIPDDFSLVIKNVLRGENKQISILPYNNQGKFDFSIMRRRVPDNIFEKSECNKYYRNKTYGDFIFTLVQLKFFE